MIACPCMLLLLLLHLQRLAFPTAESRMNCANACSACWWAIAAVKGWLSCWGAWRSSMMPVPWTGLHRSISHSRHVGHHGWHYSMMCLLVVGKQKLTHILQQTTQLLL